MGLKKSLADVLAKKFLLVRRPTTAGNYFSDFIFFLESIIGKRIPKSIAKRNDVSQSIIAIPWKTRLHKRVTPMHTKRAIAKTGIKRVIIFLKSILVLPVYISKYPGSFKGSHYWVNLSIYLGVIVFRRCRCYFLSGYQKHFSSHAETKITTPFDVLRYTGQLFA